MPFTLSHVAAIAPFSRPLARWRLLSAAVIGSMVPDFGLFSPWRPTRFETHSVDGLFTFCLPVGLATYWLFQRMLRAPLFELLPPGAYSRWRDYAAPADYRSARDWILAVFGLLAGAVSHLVWDAFTHEGARGLRMIPALEDPPVVEISGHRVGGVHLLQDANSLIGLIVLIAIVAYGLRPGSAADAAIPRRLHSAERRSWIAAYALAAAALSGVFLLATRVTGMAANEGPLSSAAIATVRGMAAAVLSVTACLMLRLRRRATA